MGNTTTKKITLKIYGQEFPLRVEENEEARVREVAEFVNTRMEELSSEYFANTTRLAIITAFQIAYELHEFQREEKVSKVEIKQVNQRIDALIKKIEKAEK